MTDQQPVRNPVTHKQHRKEAFWQIIFPLTLGVLMISALAGYIIYFAATGCCVSKGADVSLVFLILPTMLIALIPLILFAGLAYALIWLNKNSPPYFRQAQDAMNKVRDGVRKASDKVVEPMLRYKSRMAGLEPLKSIINKGKGTNND